MHFALCVYLVKEVSVEVEKQFTCVGNQCKNKILAKSCIYCKTGFEEKLIPPEKLETQVPYFSC